MLASWHVRNDGGTPFTILPGIFSLALGVVLKLDDHSNENPHKNKAWQFVQSFQCLVTHILALKHEGQILFALCRSQNVMSWPGHREEVTRSPMSLKVPFSMEVIALQNSRGGGHCVELQDGQKIKAKS